MVVGKELSREEFQRTRVVAVGVSIGEVVRPEGESEEVDRLSSLPAKASLFQVVASQALALVLLLVAQIVVLVLAEATGRMVELGPQLEMRQCFPHNLTTRSHCWSRFLFWVHLQCWKFPKEEQFAVVGVTASQEEVFDICPVLRLFR